jgi:hypothetical protein
MTLTIKLDRNWSSFQLANNTPPLSVTGSVIAPSARMLDIASEAHHLHRKCSTECFSNNVGRFHAPVLQSNVRSCRADVKCGIKLPGCIETLRHIHYQTLVARRRPGHASQRSLHNAPIFRLLLKVAVKGTHQCDFLNFCRDLCPNKCLVTTARGPTATTNAHAIAGADAIVDAAASAAARATASVRAIAAARHYHPATRT